MIRAYELNDQPQNAPATTLAADGKTTLHRYRGEFVIYALTREEAQHRLNSANIYLDAGRLDGPELRPLHVISDEIFKVWLPSPSPEAYPYARALRYLATVTDKYGDDTAEEIILKFISNAKYWRGNHARRIKAELRAHLECK
jgi:hypothetical protein